MTPTFAMLDASTEELMEEKRRRGYCGVSYDQVGNGPSARFKF
jgi:hypothetical protein